MANKGDFRGPPPKLKRKRFDHTEKAKKRKEIRKKLTKATVKRKLLHSFDEALDHLRIYNRVTSIDAKRLHLRKALYHLEACLEVRPGNHMLRAQQSLCQEELREIEKQEKETRPGQLEIVLDPDWHG